MELEAKRKQDAMDEEKIKKTNYREAIKEQHHQQMMIEKYQREIEKERERAQLLSDQLKEKERMEVEKRALVARLKQINGQTTPQRERYEILASAKKKRELEEEIRHINKWQERNNMSLEKGRLQMEIEHDPTSASLNEKLDATEDIVLESITINTTPKKTKVSKWKKTGEDGLNLDFEDIDIEIEMGERESSIVKKSSIMKVEIPPKESSVKKGYSNKKDDSSTLPVPVSPLKSPSKWARTSIILDENEIQRLKEQEESTKSGNVPINISMQICVETLVKLQLDLVSISNLNIFINLI